MKHKILFVCLGNICRSPAAEGVMRGLVDRQGQSDRWEIDSAGTGRYHIGDLPDRRMRQAGARRGYEFRHICRQVRESDFERFDLIIGMDADNVRNLRRMAPDIASEAKVHAMGEWLDGEKTGYDFVPDPYYEGAEGFELVLDLLEAGCGRLYDEIVNGKV